jgi:hypothetical protein
MSELLWWLTKDGDADCYELFERHYSSGKNRNRKQRQFVGPGEQVVLRTLEGDAVFVWRRSVYRNDGQTGIECSLFRNEGRHSSSELIRQADAIADHVWPGQRHYTHIDETKIRSTNPGFCFLRAGWIRLDRRTKKLGLRILERKPKEQTKCQETEQPRPKSQTNFTTA